MIIKFKQTLILTTVAVMAVFTAPAADQNPTTAVDSGSTQTKADSKAVSFIKQAAQDNELEVAMGELGVRKAQNAELKTFCQQLQQDHMQANQQLQPIAQKYGVTIDQPLKGKSHREVTKFEKDASGEKFDQKFATEMLKSHQKDIQKFEDAANNLPEADVKQYAETMLPKLRQHFEHAVTVARAVGVEQSTISTYSKKIPASVGGTAEDLDTTKGAGARDLKEGTSAKDPKDSSSPLNK